MKQIKTLIKTALNYVLLSREERRHSMVGPSHSWKMKRDFQINFLKRQGLQTDHYLLDIGCGTLRGGIPLIDYLQAQHYFGTETRSDTLREGRKELSDAKLDDKQPTLVLSTDVAELGIDQEFDYIWAFSVLIHMNDEILESTLRFASQHLSTGGIFFANVNIGDMKEGQWEEFPVVARTFEFYSNLCAGNGLDIIDIGSLKENGHISNADSQDNQRMLKITKKRAP